MREYYLEGGLPGEQLVATGSLANDTLARSMREAAQRGATFLTNSAYRLMPPSFWWRFLLIFFI